MISGVRASSIRIEFDLVHDGVDVPALDHVLQPVLHVVAQIVEAELVIGAVGHVGVVGRLALLVVQPVHDHPDRQPEEVVDLAHPFGVALGEVVVHRHHMHPAAAQRVEIHRKRRHQRLAFAGLHLRDPPLVQDHPADELHVEVPLPQRPHRRLTAGGKGRHQDVVQARALRDLLLERLRARPQRLVRQTRQFLLQRVDLRNARQISLDPTLVRRTKQLAGNNADHAVSPSRLRCLGRTLANPKGRNATEGTDFGAATCAGSSEAAECGKCRTFRAFFMQTTAACGRIGRVCGEIGGGYILVNRP